jgi:hypothetical protein
LKENCPTWVQYEEKGDDTIMTAQFRRRLMGVIALLIAWTSLGNNVRAGGFDNKDFSLRFPAAFSRFSSYADVAATGGACAGSKWQSSVNPAAMDWQNMPGHCQLGLNPQYSSIFFQEGAVLHVISESATKELQQFGTFELALAQLRSNDYDTRQGIRFSSDMDYVQVQWGKRFPNDLALGGNFNYSSTEVANKIDALTLADASSDAYDFRFGTLFPMAENLLGGLVLDYGWSPSTTIIYDIFNYGIGDLRIKDRTKQFILRTGPSYEFKKDSIISLDYQYGSFKNDTGEMEVHRMLAGIDYGIMEALFVRGGFAADNQGNASWTCGLGIYPLKELGIDMGYQYDMFPELQPEFGRSHLLTLSISLVL